MTRGGCFCGAVRYEADGRPSDETLCHCSICRRTSGAPSVAWFTLASTDVRVTKGTPAEIRSSPSAVRSFCGTCGTPLFFRYDATPDRVDITICSLDDPESVRPQDHTWTRSRLSWVRPGDGLPEHREDRSRR
jgi:hypothetical protein